MAKDKDMTAEDIFALVSSYMNDEHVAFVKKHIKRQNLRMRDNLEVRVKRILSIQYKSLVF